jgi:hypothetical protein
MKGLLIAFITFTIIASEFALAAPSNKNRFIPLLTSKLGSYTVVEKNASLCVDAKLSLINPNIPDAGFTLGTQIVFENLHNGTQTLKKPGFCFITSSLKYKSDGLDNKIRMSRCINPANEKTFQQRIHFINDTTLTYSLSEPSVECTFKKKP